MTEKCEMENMKIVKTEAAQRSINCTACNDMGWETYQADVEGYGPAVFARPCSKCKGLNRTKDKTGIPPQFYDADIHKFKFDSYSVDMSKVKKITMDFFDNYSHWREKGKGLYIWSKEPGSGKTFLVSSIAKSVMMKYNLRMRFITVIDYLDAVAESYKRERGTEDKSKIYRECDMLVLDDVGAQKSGEWQEQELFKLINERMNACAVTLFTSNMEPEDLNIGPRLVDRIIKSSVVLKMPEESIRRKEARKEQESFLREILQEKRGDEHGE